LTNTHTTINEPAIAKAKLLREALNTASTLGLSTTAHALLAHLIADAWPRGSSWVATTPQATLANRLGIHRGNVARATAELAPVVLYTSGRGTRKSRFIILPNAAPAQQPNACSVDAPAQHPTPRLRSDHAAPAQHPTLRQRSTYQLTESHQQQQQCPPAQPPPPTDRAAAAFAPLSADQAQVYAQLAERPQWLDQRKGWIDYIDARNIAALPTSSIELLKLTIRAARDSRNSLTNPAGYVLSRLRSPDPQLIAALALQRAHAVSVATANASAVEAATQEHQR